MESLEEAVELILSGQREIRCGLAGCPVGGWAETLQARRRLADDLPRRSERSYSLDQLIDRLYYVDHADRYRWRHSSPTGSS